MKATELRIGNLITITENEKEALFNSLNVVLESDILEVSKIDKDELILIIQDINDGSEEIEFYYENVKPIPITEEWLLKFGFEKEADFFSKEINLIGVITSMDLVIPGTLWDHDTYIMKYTLHRTELLKHFKYIHELQNFYFALINQELEIKKSKDEK